MPNYKLEHLIEQGILTGSRAFNVATETSDWDIVIIESRVPNKLTNGIFDWTEYKFANCEELRYCEEAGSDIDDDGLYEYDKISIWGPILRVIKYSYPIVEDYDNCDDSHWVTINLFVYGDNSIDLYEKFKLLNFFMCLIDKAELEDKDIRIDYFTEIIDKVGITNA